MTTGEKRKLNASTPTPISGSTNAIETAYLVRKCLETFLM